MTSTMLARIVKLEEQRRPIVDREAERRSIAEWAAANPEEASRLVSQVSARLLGPGNESSAYYVPPEPDALWRFFMGKR